MLTYKIYWNNICILSRYEELYMMEKLKHINKKYGINIEIEYFGLGKKKKLSEQLKDDLENENMVDIIVSTDLEIFEDNSIYEKYEKHLQNLDSIFKIKEEIKNSNINRSEKLVPFLTIPLLIVVNKKLLKNESPNTIKDIIYNDYEDKIVFGGINNSAGTSVVKGIWYKYKEDGLKNFKNNSIIKEMPIQAFNAVKKGEYPLGIVPSIFAKIGENDKNLKIIWPKDGAIAIPSYIAIKNNVDLKVINILKEEVLNIEFSNFFVNRGDIISCLEGSIDKEYVVENKSNLIYPSDSWLKNLNNKEFKRIYENIYKE